MCLGKFPPIDWNTLNDSLTTASEIVQQCTQSANTTNNNASYSSYSSYIDKIKNIQNAYKILDLNECSKYLINDIKGTVFNAGYNNEIDGYNIKLNDALAKLRRFENDINQYDVCNIDCNERDGYFINITKKRWETVKSRTKKICGFDTSSFVAKPISSSSNVLRLTHVSMETYSNEINECHKILSKITTDAYIEFLNNFYVENNNDLASIATLLASIDISSTCAKNAHEFNYVRPRLVDNTEGSYIVAKDIRHPIIERIHTDIEYIANDVSLGNVPNTSKQSKIGLLLYGSNSSGKSSYMKSVGLNIIMAQSGMYAAATEINIAPYKSLFTRIQGNDNVYKRMSTFIVEMTELRNIFQRCNTHSLVLGDELCSGTESVSATAIVAAGTHNLLERKTTFIFATHLHELITIPLIKEHSSLLIAHIHVDISPNGVFIYDRKLRDGSGSSIYGVEVCESLGMPIEFIKMAQHVRKHILDITPIATKKSSYNSQVYIEKCGVCNTNKATEVHHIKYQCNGGTNSEHNLVPLCTKCHNEEHNGYLNIQGYIMTSTGRKLDFSYNQQSICVLDTVQNITPQEIDLIKPFVKYSIAGWFIKKTPKGKWQLASAANVIGFITSKFTKINVNNDSIDFLKTHLLVV
jgi:DNA mismatch repair protein MutS